MTRFGFTAILGLAMLFASPRAAAQEDPDDRSTRRRTVRALELVAASARVQDDEPATSLLLAREAARHSMAPAVQARLREALHRCRERACWEGHDDPITVIATDWAANTIVTSTERGDVVVRGHDGRVLKKWSATRTGGWTYWTQFEVIDAGTRLLSRRRSPDQWMLHSLDGQPLTGRGAGDEAPVILLAASPDGERMATAHEDGQVTLWSRPEEPGPARSERTLTGHSQPVLAIAWAPDGQHLATASRDRTVRVWTAEGEAVGVLQVTESVPSRAPFDKVLALAFSPSGRQLLTGSQDGSVRIRALDGTDELVLRPPVEPRSDRRHSIQFVSFAPAQGSAKPGYVLSATESAIDVWASDGNHRRRLSAGLARLSDIRMHPTLPLVLARSSTATADERGRVHVWNVNNGWEVASLPGGPVAFGPARDAEASVLIGGADGRLRRHALEFGESRPLDRVAEQAHGVAWSPDGSHFAVAGSNRQSIQVFRADGTRLARMETERGGLWCVTLAFSPDGRHLLCSGDTGTQNQDGFARVWDLDGKEVARLSGVKQDFGASAFTADGTRILTLPASSWGDKRARLWDLNGEVVAELENCVPSDLDIAPDGKTALTFQWGRSAVLRAADGRAVADLGRAQSGCFLPGGASILLADGASVRVVDHEGTPLAALDAFTRRITALAVDPDGHRVLVGSEDGTARLWRPGGDGAPLLLLHPGPVTHAAISADGRHVVTATRTTVHLWNAKGESVGVLRDAGTHIRDLVISPDGKTLLTAAWSGGARLWTLDTDALPARVDARLPRDFLPRERKAYARLLQPLDDD